MTAQRHYAHLTDSSIQESAVTQHRAALFPPLYAVNAANQSISGATETDLTSLTALNLPVLTVVNTRIFEVDFTVQVTETSGSANLITIRLYNGANGTKADTREFAGGVLMSASALAGQVLCCGYRFTPGASDRTKVGLAIITSGNCTVLGTNKILSFLRVTEVPV